MPSTGTNPNRWPLLLTGGGVALALVLWLAFRQPEPAHQLQPPPTTSSPKAAVVQSTTNTTTAPAIRSDGRLQEVCEALRKESNARIIRQKLAELRKELSAMPTKEAVGAVRQFLDSKADVSTHLGFKLSSNGLLDDAPTLRTFLLDELAHLDPAAAAEYAAVVLASMDSPDAWAVVLVAVMVPANVDQLV
jgi:hypothetical protein